MIGRCVIALARIDDSARSRSGSGGRLAHRRAYRVETELDDPVRQLQRCGRRRVAGAKRSDREEDLRHAAGGDTTGRLREDVADWFDLASDSPYMLIVADVRKDKHWKISPDEQALFGIDKLNVSRSQIPAVTHVDYSARIQTVHRETNPLFHQLLCRFKALTGCPVLVNTSFNVRGEPIVCTPEDAFRCFMGNELDLLVVGNCLLQKNEQDARLKIDYSASLNAD